MIFKNVGIDWRNANYHCSR